MKQQMMNKSVKIVMRKTNMSYACECCNREIDDKICPHCGYDNDYHDDELLIGEDEDE